MEGELLIVFVKAPRIGAVKTRLARAIGPEAATRAYCRSTETLFQNLSTLDAVQIRVSPDDGKQEVERWRRQGWMVSPQGEGDLGQRLEAAFAEAFSRGIRRAVIIGSDCPTVTAADIQRSWAELHSHDLVLGPAADGGYWLIGLNRSQPALFERIPWSSDRVLSETLSRARTAGSKVALLQQRSDVDTEADWNLFLSGKLL